MTELSNLLSCSRAPILRPEIWLVLAGFLYLLGCVSSVAPLPNNSENNTAVQGRYATEAAAAQLAALTSDREVAAIQEQMVLANTPPSMRPKNDVMTGAAVRNLFPTDILAPAPLIPPDIVRARSGPGPEPEKLTARETLVPATTTAIHLASYKKRSDADIDWNILVKKHPELRSLDATVIKVDLGPPKGIYYRLVADGISSREQARRLCRSINDQGHNWCQMGEVLHKNPAPASPK